MNCTKPRMEDILKFVWSGFSAFENPVIELPSLFYSHNSRCPEHQEWEGEANSLEVLLDGWFCVEFHSPEMSVRQSRDSLLGRISSLRDPGIRSIGIAEMNFANASPDMNIQTMLARVLRYWSAKIS